MAGISLPFSGTISYGSFTFSGPRYRTTMEIEPKYDDAGRAVEYSIYRLSVAGTVTDDIDGTEGTGGSASTVLATIEQSLLKPGQSLVVTGLGYANLDLSASRDVRWGPRPKLIKLAPVGGVGCFEIEWQVEVAVNRCNASQGLSDSLGNVLSLNYEVLYSIDGHGLTVRTVNGHIAIALNRSAIGGTAIAMTADDFRERVVVVPPVADFKRERQDYRLSLDKSRVDFTVVDRQLPGDNSFPPGVADMDLTHSISASRGLRVFQAVYHDLSGYVETAKGVARSVGLVQALLICRDRAAFIRQRGQQLGGTVLLDSINFIEHIYGRRIEFTIRFAVIGARTSIGDSLSNAGFFRPTPTDFTTWNRSLITGPWGPRGSANLKHNASSDRIISTCEGGTGLVISDGAYRPPSTGALGALQEPCPPRERSYLYRNRSVRFEQSSGDVSVSVMPTASTGGTQSQIPQPIRGSVGSTTAIGTPSPVDSESIKVAPDTYFLRMCVSAARICYKVDPPPEIRIHMGRVWAVLKPEALHSEGADLGFIGGHPLYGAKWCAVYKLDEGTALYIQDRIKKEGDEWLLELVN